MKTAASFLLSAIMLTIAFVLLAMCLPSCGPDEVMVRGLFPPFVCVKGHQ